MNRLLLLSLFWLSSWALSAQLNEHPLVVLRNGDSGANPEWAPFFHGLASGDPLEDRVIIWTRVTPDDLNTESIEVEWQVATDAQLMNVVKSGTFTTTAERDYTVKVDVTGLEPGTTYYYGFKALGRASLTGRTKTTPIADQTDHLRFAIVSCSNYPAGYFNAYKRIAERNDLDAVIHLGDYIYEYAQGVYEDSTVAQDRPNIPANEILSVEDYRTRYSTYRLDTALARVHQQHPFITVWDDHESANDSYVDGAENHDPETEGDWETRKAIARQVYFEWMPIRDTEDQSVYRKLSYGNIADLIMLDTRLEGREIQIFNVLDSALYAEDRTLLGTEQKAWLKEQLETSTANWKIIGQQVIFSPMELGWGALQDTTFNYYEIESLFLDIWDGYPAEREEIIDLLVEKDIDNAVFLTGDFHTAFAMDVTKEPALVSLQEIPPLGTVPFYAESPTYDPETGEGSVAVEFVCSSVSSANFDENVGLEAAVILQAFVNNPIELPGFPSLGNPNPHIKYADLIQHGYYLLDVKSDTVQADYYISPIDQVVGPEFQVFMGGFYSLDGENRLQTASGQSREKSEQDEPAPNDPPIVTSLEGIEQPANFTLLGVYPNPFKDAHTLHYSLSESNRIRIQMYDAAGKLVQTIREEQLPAGAYTQLVDGRNLPEGTYLYRIQVGEQVYTTKVVK